uniref:Uncharacterized protein n=1 Tax=Knipowitschia caucasica TaxID=637954 RepID=A0AAV2JCC0_KNICA
MVFDFEAFVEEPSLEELNKCKKKDLIALAVHFNILYSKQSRKDEIRALLVDGLVELGLLSQPVASEGTDESIVPAGTPKREEKPGPSDGSPPGTKRAGAGVDEPPNPLFTLPRYDPHSPPTSPRSLDAARRAVRLARIKMEAEQKERDRSAKLEFQVRKLEIEADKDVKLRRLELEAEGRLPPSPTPGPGPTAQAAAHSPSVHGGALDGLTGLAHLLLGLLLRGLTGRARTKGNATTAALLGILLPRVLYSDADQALRNLKVLG